MTPEQQAELDAYNKNKLDKALADKKDRIEWEASKADAKIIAQRAMDRQNKEKELQTQQKQQNKENKKYNK